MKKKRDPLYVASVQYDTEDGQTADSYAYGKEFKHIVESVNDLLKIRRNSEVLFASYIDRNEREYDVTDKVREECMNQKL
jgi:hypothetical protein